MTFVNAALIFLAILLGCAAGAVVGWFLVMVPASLWEAHLQREPRIYATPWGRRWADRAHRRRAAKGRRR